MSDIKVIISIPEDEYNIIKKSNAPMTWVEHLIAKGVPLSKNDLGVDAVSRAEVHNMLENLPITVEDKWFNWLQKACMRLADLPSVTPQEPRWIPVSEKKPDKGGEYLLWGKIDESEEEEYCFVGDYYEFDEVFGTEISNYDPKTLGFIDTEIEEYYSVVAWMPLPKPYSEEEE